MQILDHLGVALGLASVAGVDLYLTVLLTGIMVHFNFLHLTDQYHEMAVLGHPWVMGVAAGMFAIEFVADKVPWLDSLWDAVHTFIRPIGGALLGMQALGNVPPEWQVIGGLLAGGAALTTHTAKAGTRLVVNHSPEPVSNIALSVGEDVAVVGGTALIFSHPVISLVVFTIILTVLWILLPKLFRMLGKTFQFLRGKWRGRGAVGAVGS